MDPDSIDLESIGANALKVLEPFGFVDCGEGSNPALIWHPDLHLSLDMSAADPYSVIKLVGEAMLERGRQQAKAECRKAIGA